MSFVSKGTEEQVESAASIAVATHHGVPLSIVTVDATVQYYRRLRTGRESTSSKSWTVDYLIVADESTINRVHDFATELSDAATALDFYGLPTRNLLVQGAGLEMNGPSACTKPFVRSFVWISNNAMCLRARSLAQMCD